MGITSFLLELEKQFVEEFDGSEIPLDLDIEDWESTSSWLQESFMTWFLKHREEELSWEWVKCGWVDPAPRLRLLGQSEPAFRVRANCVDNIDAWLQDKI